MMRTECWVQTVLNFESARSYQNPFLEVSIWAEFTGPNGETVRREAYWDGGATYRVAFAPTAVGLWHYALTAPKETGLNGVSGAVESVPYTGSHAIYRHGFLKVGHGGRCLTYHDGTPFFWLGDTHWEFAYRERWDESNHPGMTSMFKGMADLRAKQGYNVYQTNLRSDDFGEMLKGSHHYWDKTREDDLPNVAFYQNELDRRMLYLANLGFVNALGQAWGMSVLGEGGIERQKHLARYLMARYGALPVVWTLAGEVAGYDSATRTACIDGWREVALYIAQRDGYGTLQTAHYTNERPFADYYLNEDWFDFTLNQAGHGDYTISPGDYRSYANAHPGRPFAKPFVEGEAMYEFVSTLEEMGTRLCTASMVRRVAYLTIQLGGCGYTYGAQGIWDCVWEKGHSLPGMMRVFNRFDISWGEAIEGEGGAQMGLMRQFYEQQHFEELMPFAMAGYGNLLGKRTPLAAVTADGGRVVAYYPDGRCKPLSLPGLQNTVYRLRWFDPRTGVYAEAGETMAENGTLTLPEKPDEEDWLLVAETQ